MIPIRFEDYLMHFPDSTDLHKGVLDDQHVGWDTLRWMWNNAQPTGKLKLGIAAASVVRYVVQECPFETRVIFDEFDEYVPRYEPGEYDRLVLNLVRWAESREVRLKMAVWPSHKTTRFTLRYHDAESAINIFKGSPDSDVIADYIVDRTIESSTLLCAPHNLNDWLNQSPRNLIALATPFINKVNYLDGLDPKWDGKDWVEGRKDLQRQFHLVGTAVKALNLASLDLPKPKKGEADPIEALANMKVLFGEEDPEALAESTSALLRLVRQKGVKVLKPAQKDRLIEKLSGLNA